MIQQYQAKKFEGTAAERRKVMLHAAQRFFPEIAPGIMTALESRQR